MLISYDFPFLQIPHLDTTDQDMLARGWLLLLFTLVQGELRKYPSAWPPWTQEEEKQSFFRRRRTDWRPGCEELLVAGWLASGHHTCPWVPRAHLLTHRSVTSHHLLARMEQEARWSARKPWFACRQLGYMLDLELYSLYNLSQSYTLGQISVMVEEKPGGLFL